MMQTYHARTEEEAEAVTTVWWDMNRCPVPAGVDARLFGPFIKESLKKLGYRGRLTITAIGKLTEVDKQTLRDLYSTGVALHHVPTEALVAPLAVALKDYPPPANLMVISRQGFLDGFLGTLPRYNILGSLGLDQPNICYYWERRRRCYYWESLLASIHSPASGHLVRERLPEVDVTVEPAFYCGSCKLDLLGFTSLYDHLYSKEHALRDLRCHPVGGPKAAHDSKGMDADAIRGVLKRLRETPRKRYREEEGEEEVTISSSSFLYSTPSPIVLPWKKQSLTPSTILLPWKKQRT